MSKTNTRILILSALICILYAIVFSPITWQAQGDSLAYITLAKQFLGLDASHADLSFKSPFYSMVLAFFIMFFEEKTSIQIMIYLQYLLVFLTSIYLFKIFDKLIDKKYILTILVLVYLFNLSTIYFGFIILTETMTQFLVVYLAYLVIKYRDNETKKWFLIWMGIVSAISVLTRFNLAVLPLFIWLCICIDHFIKFGFKRVKLLLKRTFLYFLPILLFLNLWCYINYMERGFYFLWPPLHMSSNYVVLPMVDKNTKVSPEYRDILKIILEAKEKVNSIKPEITDSSIFNFIPAAEFIQKINSGRNIYSEARPELLNYFHLKSDSNYLFNKKLKPILNEISSQNKTNILLMRTFSFLLSFKWIYKPLPVNTKINLNILPSIFVIAYKLIFLSAMILFILLSVLFIIKTVVNKTLKQNYVQLILLILIYYFPLMNFLVITYSDANRFKFPAEPLIFGMIFYFSFGLRNDHKIEKNRANTQS